MMDAHDIDSIIMEETEKRRWALAVIPEKKKRKKPMSTTMRLTIRLSETLPIPAKIIKKAERYCKRHNIPVEYTDEVPGPYKKDKRFEGPKTIFTFYFSMYSEKELEVHYHKLWHIITFGENYYFTYELLGVYNEDDKWPCIIEWTY